MNSTPPSIVRRQKSSRPAGIKHAAWQKNQLAVTLARPAFAIGVISLHVKLIARLLRNLGHQRRLASAILPNENNVFTPRAFSHFLNPSEKISCSQQTAAMQYAVRA